MQLTEKGINYAASIAADMVSTEVKKTKIDDISGKKKVRYWVKNIKVKTFFLVLVSQHFTSVSNNKFQLIIS